MFRLICLANFESFPKIFLSISVSNRYKKCNVEKFSFLKIRIIIRYAIFKKALVLKSEWNCSKLGKKVYFCSRKCKLGQTLLTYEFTENATYRTSLFR